MSQPHSPLLERWLPPDSRHGLLRRGAIVWGVAVFIGLLNWVQKPQGLDTAMVYSFAISTSIWFCTDVMRIAGRRWLQTTGPHYWNLSPRMVLFLVGGCLLGYVAGTAAGDAYSQQSTLGLLVQSPSSVWSVVLFSLGISLAFLAYFYQREKGLALERQATEARLKLLETQLEPHMLFNTLANLRVLIQTDPPRAVAMLDRLGDYLRATLRGSRTDATAGTHTLADEFARLNDYLELMAVRMGPRLRHTLQAPDELLVHPVPPLLLQPLVENAIRHGLEPRVEGGQIAVRARPDGRLLLIEVTDTGVGMAPTAMASAEGGFGLAQVRERVAGLGSGSSAGQVQVLSQPGQGTTVRLKLPLQPTAAP